VTSSGTFSSTNCAPRFYGGAKVSGANCPSAERHRTCLLPTKEISLTSCRLMMSANKGPCWPRRAVRRHSAAERAGRRAKGAASPWRAPPPPTGPAGSPRSLPRSASAASCSACARATVARLSRKRLRTRTPRQVDFGVLLLHSLLVAVVDVLGALQPDAGPSDTAAHGCRHTHVELLVALVHVKRPRVHGQVQVVVLEEDLRAGR
jgi:hypothetical protein